MIFELLKGEAVATDLAKADFFPTNHPEKTFQITLEAAGVDAALAANTALELTATVKIQVSNDKKNWFERLAPVVVTKPAGQASGSALFPAENEMWGYYRPVITSIDAGGKVSLFMAMSVHR